ncbi:unnamed protein product [Ectocarpus sp. CCAP 1310/34]|nr:unnamed protein product [Ectocarpus sp. CCAP 1310/34]
MKPMGKSLSVICSALQWLKDAEAKDVDGKSDGGGSPAGGGGGYGTESASRGRGEKDDDDDGASAMPSWLRDMTRQKSDNEKGARAKRVRERRRDLDERLAAVRKEDEHRKNNNKVRGVHRPSGGRGGGGGGGGGRHWSSSSFALGGSDRGGAGRKRPRPKISASSSKHPPKTENQTRGDGVGCAADDGDGKRSAEEGVDDEYLVAEYDSGKEGGDGGKGGGRGFRESSDEEEEAGEGRGAEEEEEWEDLGLRQILYVSRTHSQTSQFVNEVKKTAFAKGVRCASLGSRRTLCGNERVSSLKTDGKMRDACLELQKNKKSSSKKTNKGDEGKGGKHGAKKSKKKQKAKTEPLTEAKRKQKHGAGGLGTRKSEGEEGEEEEEDDDDEDEGTTDGCPLLAADGQREFPYRALASVRDIEELAALGKEEGTCAYYGARKAASLAQLVVMPYAALLSREARAAMGVRLEGAVVVVDEAHNIVEAINSVHSKKVVLSEARSEMKDVLQEVTLHRGSERVARAHSQLSQYEVKYGTRLKGSNAFYVGNILRLLRAVLKFLTKGKEKLQAARAENAKTTAAAAASKGNTGVQGPRGGGAGAGAAGGEAEEAGVRSEMLEVNDFLFRAGLDNVNLFKLQRYMRRSEISRKVCVGSSRYGPEEKETGGRPFRV